jgi:NDP-sugar pyrophosphorylase family protein
MRVADLYSLPTERDLTEWLQQFVDLRDLLASVPQLFARSTRTIIPGTVEDGALIVAPVHIGEGSTVRANSVITGPDILVDRILHLVPCRTGATGGNPTNWPDSNVGFYPLGQNVEVSYGAIVRDQICIGANCCVDSGSVTTQSLIFNKSGIGEMASVRRSIVGVCCSISVRAVSGAASGLANVASGTFIGEMSVVGAECRLEEESVVAACSVIRARDSGQNHQPMTTWKALCAR